MTMKLCMYSNNWKLFFYNHLKYFKIIILYRFYSTKSYIYMEKKLYSSNEIVQIKKSIEKYKNFYLESNKKQSIIWLQVLLGI